MLVSFWLCLFIIFKVLFNDYDVTDYLNLWTIWIFLYRTYLIRESFLRHKKKTFYVSLLFTRRRVFLQKYAVRLLRYYATFKVRKFESLFYKINTCLQKSTACIGLKAEQIFSVNTWHTYFSILGVAFTLPCLFYFQKLQLLVVKRFWTNFCCIVILYLWAQKECLSFLKSYFKLEILIILSFVVSFLVDRFN